MWNIQELERKAEEALIKDRGESAGKEKFALYTVARMHVVEEILSQIKAVQPDLTDHSEKHVADVLSNAYQLLGEESDNLSSTELYCQIICILFHDVGNIYNRDEHRRKVAEVYDYIRNDPSFDHNEKFIIMQAALAHCGTGCDGTNDTLKYIDINPCALDRKPVRLRDIAAILRFADELAEGPHRTSTFMLKNDRYKAKSKIYHQYAKATQVIIDRKSGRISLTYNINIQDNAKPRLSIRNEKSLRNLLAFIYKRIVKLDQERRYTKHYCEWLSPFKKTTVALRFWVAGQLHELGLNKLELTDLVVPEHKEKLVEKLDPDYRIDTVMSRIGKTLARRTL